MKIVSIQIAKPKIVTYRNKPISTGFFKDPVAGPVMLRTLNIEGDGQADLRVHGGRDKALYAYALDAYPAWSELRPNDVFNHGAFGENLSMEKLPEQSIYVGDTFRIGGAVIQAVQPRFPCFKLGIKFNDPSMVQQFMEFGRPGVYFRVLEEGLLDIGDELKLTDRESIHVSIHELFELFKSDDINLSRAREILKVQSLPDNLRRKLHASLDGSH